MTHSGVRIRELRGPEDAVAVTRLFADVWQLRPGDPVPIDEAMLIALAHSGSYVALAEHGSGDQVELVGGCVGFFTAPPVPALHSHITGVRRDLAGRGVGTALKRHQRTWCLARGVEMITWTFDPLVSRNAHLNINRLGARVSEYMINFYGNMADGVNAGQPSDRVLARWRLTDPGAAPTTDRDEVDTVSVPDDIEALRITDPPAALAWRYQLREALTGRLAEGWQIAGFERGSGYRLEHPQGHRAERTD